MRYAKPTILDEFSATLQIRGIFKARFHVDSYTWLGPRTAVPAYEADE